MTEFLTVYPGWNVWQVWQVKDLPFSLMMVGVSPERQLRIWTEDAVRLGAPGANVSDSIDLKGGQVELLRAAPEGLSSDKRKESVPGPAMTVSGPANLFTLRFFNRGKQAQMVWPHDESYLLEQTFKPSPVNPATAGPGPGTIAGNTGSGITKPLSDIGKELLPLLLVGGALVLGYYAVTKETFNNVKRRIRNFRPSGSRRVKGS